MSLLIIAFAVGLLAGISVGIFIERWRWNDVVGFLRKKQEEKE